MTNPTWSDVEREKKNTAGVGATVYTFVWSPEGRPVFMIRTISYQAAKAAFKRACPQYAKYMGEVYCQQS